MKYKDRMNKCYVTFSYKADHIFIIRTNNFKGNNSKVSIHRGAKLSFLSTCFCPYSYRVCLQSSKEINFQFKPFKFFYVRISMKKFFMYESKKRSMVKIRMTDSCYSKKITADLFPSSKVHVFSNSYTNLINY